MKKHIIATAAAAFALSMNTASVFADVIAEPYMSEETFFAGKALIVVAFVPAIIAAVLLLRKKK